MPKLLQESENGVGIRMKPKRVICPICGEIMIAEEWGIKKQIYRGIGNIRAPGEIDNYVHYVCPCGNKMSYQGTKDCWEHE